MSVVIVNYNSGELLKQCLASLEKQTVRPLQIFVIDNASSDGSADHLVTVNNVIFCPMPDNLGFAKGNNWAIRQCLSDYVALLNPDAFAEPDWLEQLLIATVNNPQVAAFGSRQLCSNKPEIIDGTGDVYHISGLAWRAGYGIEQQADDLVEREIFAPCAAAALYGREVLLSIGGFDEDYFCYVEDVDVGFRLRLAGYRALYVPNAVVRHVGSATTGGQHSEFSVYHGHRNLVWTFVKNVPGALFWLLLPLHLLLNVVSVLWFVRQGRGGAIIRAKRDALLGLPSVWKKRQKIQQTRVAKVGDIWTMMDKRFIGLKKRYKRSTIGG